LWSGFKEIAERILLHIFPMRQLSDACFSADYTGIGHKVALKHDLPGTESHFEKAVQIPVQQVSAIS